MKKTTGEGLVINPWGKLLLAGGSKVGKTCFEVASALGVLPWSKQGGVVDSPENLHVLAIDPGALEGINRFLLETCKAPKEALKYKAYLFEDELRQVATSKSPYGTTMHNAIQSTLQAIGQECKGVPMVIVSSVTVLQQVMKRDISGPPASKPGPASGVGMDQNKNAQLNFFMSEVRYVCNGLPGHVVFEAHTSVVGIDDNKQEVLQLQGAQREEFPANVPYFFGIRRDFGSKAPGSSVDMTYINARPTGMAVLNGRNATEALNPKEPDMAEAFTKLGLKVGGWNSK